MVGLGSVAHIFPPMSRNDLTKIRSFESEIQSRSVCPWGEAHLRVANVKLHDGILHERAAQDEGTETSIIDRGHALSVVVEVVVALYITIQQVLRVEFKADAV